MQVVLRFEINASYVKFDDMEKNNWSTVIRSRKPLQ